MSYVLTIPDQEEAKKLADKAPSSGMDEVAELLKGSPLARSERGKPCEMDHVYLSRFQGTNLCQWFGRCADGYHRPIGRIMKIVRESP